MVEARRRRYAASIMSLLPEEILEAVFKEFAAKVFRQFTAKGLYLRSSPFEIVTLTHVCAIWRRVAITARIWYLIDLDDDRKGLSNLFLSRSSRGPIRIAIRSGKPNAFPQGYANFLGNNTSRADGLFFHTSPATIREVLSPLRRNLTFVKVLDLSCEMRAGQMLDLRLTMPSLRQLRLEKLFASVESCPNLTHLSIRSAAGCFVFRILSMLSISGHLQEILLEDISATPLFEAWPSKITLASLKTFKMTEIDFLPAILANIISPPSSTMKIHLRKMPVPLDLFPPDLTDLQFLHSTDQHVLKLDKQLMVLYRDSVDPDAAFSITIDRGSLMDQLETFQRSICSQATIKELHILGTGIEVELILSKGHFDRLEYLYVRDLTHWDVSSVLLFGLGNSSPKLQHIKLEGMTFDTSEERLNRMRLLFALNSKRIIPLRTVEFINCSPLPCWLLEACKNLVENLVFRRSSPDEPR